VNQNSDEQRRFLLALTLSLGLLMVFQYVILPNGTQNRKKSAAKTKQKKQKQPKEDGDAPGAKNVSSGSTKPETPPDEPTSSGSSGTDPSGTSADSAASEDESAKQSPAAPSEPDDEKPSGQTPPADGYDTGDENAPALEEPASDEFQKVVLENKRLKMTFTSRGATLRSLILKEFHRTAQKKHKVQLFDDRFKETRSFDVKPNKEDDTLHLRQKNWRIVSRPTSGSPDQPLIFQYRTRDGLIIRKSFQLTDEDPYMISYDVTFSSDERRVETPQMKLYSPSGIVLQSKQDQAYHQGVYGFKSGDEWVFENGITASYLSDEEAKVHNVDGPCWTGLTNKYFGSALIPTTNRKDLLGYSFERLSKPGADQAGAGSPDALEEILHPVTSVTSYFVTKDMKLDLGDEQSYSFLVYAGPKEESELNKYAEYGLPRMINYVMFIGFLSETFITLLGYLYNLIGNYGAAILLLTLIVKLCLHPITRKAQISMHKMKDLQPKIEALQEKYEDDRQKLGEKQMELFKEHGVNPLGGCLPMLFQIPVLIGLYYGIRVSFQVRQKPFVLWINDLSQPDHFMEIGLGQVMGIDFQYLNLLIILMMATWLLQALTQPSPDTGQGQGMQSAMKFMPMVFGVICYNFASGLVLYWMMSTLFSALEQLYIRNVVLPGSS